MKRRPLAAYIPALIPARGACSFPSRALTIASEGDTTAKPEWELSAAYRFTRLCATARLLWFAAVVRLGVVQ